MDSSLTSLYRLEPSTRARLFRAVVDPAAGVVAVRIPKDAGEEEVAAYLASHAAWARAALGRLPRATPFAPGAVLPLFGIRHRIAVAGHDIDGDGMPRLLAAAGDAVSVREAVECHAQEWFATAVAEAAVRLDRVPGPVVVGDISKNGHWGTCRTDGLITLSWRLAFAPPEVAGYIAAHEAAHLVDMGHGAVFWAACRAGAPMRPDDAHRWLRRHGGELQRYGAPR